MSRQYGICCVNCNKALNSEDEIFGTSCGHLYHAPCISSIHGKSAQCIHCESYKPLIFKMHLKFDDSPLSGKLQEKNIEIIDKLNNYERTNAFLNNSYNAARRSIQQLETKIKTLKDGIQAKDDVINELQENIEKLEAFNHHLLNKDIHNAAGFNNKHDKTEDNCSKNDNDNTKQQQSNKNIKSKKTKQLFNEENKNNRNTRNRNPYKANKAAESISNRSSDDNDIEDVSSASSQPQHTSAQEQDILDEALPVNNVVIENFKSSDLRRKSAMLNVIKLGRRMGLNITSHEIIDIFVYEKNQHFLNYVVEFCSENLKNRFLQKSSCLRKFPETKFLTIS